MKKRHMHKYREFRVHHILCTQLYQGLGYDGDFCENMTAIVSDLRKNPDQPLRLVAKADAICANCPNRLENDFCTNGDNHVAIKKYLTKDVFDESCASCNWYQQGICKYEKLQFTPSM